MSEPQLNKPNSATRSISRTALEKEYLRYDRAMEIEAEIMHSVLLKKIEQEKKRRQARNLVSFFKIMD
jgi:hypothetical protein